MERSGHIRVCSWGRILLQVQSVKLWRGGGGCTRQRRGFRTVFFFGNLIDITLQKSKRWGQEERGIKTRKGKYIHNHAAHDFILLIYWGEWSCPFGKKGATGLSTNLEPSGHIPGRRCREKCSFLDIYGETARMFQPVWPTPICLGISLASPCLQWINELLIGFYCY